MLRADNLEATRAIAFSDPLHATGASAVTVHDGKHASDGFNNRWIVIPAKAEALFNSA